MANKKADIPIFSSIFDPEESASQDNKDSHKFYQKAPTSVLANAGLLNNTKLTGKLLELSKNGKSKKKKFFVLSEDRLYLYNKILYRVSSVKFINLSEIRVKFGKEQKDKEVDELFSATFFKSKKSSKVYFSTLKEYQQFKEIVINVSILTDFAEKYKMIREIDEGGFAKVSMLERRKDSSLFAGKMFAKEAFFEKKSILKSKEALLNEIKIMRMLKSPFTPELIEVFETIDHIIFIMELYDKGDLFDLLVKNPKLNEKQIKKIMKDLLGAMQVLHVKNIIHRDIKPSNIMFHKNQLKLIDFGLATFVDSQDPMRFKKCGTQGFVAPEILCGMNFDCRSDVYSAGVVFFILVLGEIPYHYQELKKVLYLNEKHDINFDILRKKESVSENGLDLVEKMLEKHPEKRISTEEALTHPWFKEKKAPPAKKITKEETIYSCHTNGMSDQHSPWENMEIFKERYSENNFNFNVGQINPTNYEIVGKNSNSQALNSSLGKTLMKDESFDSIVYEFEELTHLKRGISSFKNSQFFQFNLKFSSESEAGFKTHSALLGDKKFDYKAMMDSKGLMDPPLPSIRK